MGASIDARAACESLTFQAEPLRDIIAEAEVLWRAHWLETEGYRHSQPYDPDNAQYVRMDECGMFRQYTGRIDGELIAHLGYITHKSRHTSRLNAIEDYFYVTPKARLGWTAMQLLRFAVADLKSRGCVQIGMSSKLTNDIDVLLRRAGFEHVGNFYVMNVTENL